MRSVAACILLLWAASCSSQQDPGNDDPRSGAIPLSIEGVAAASESDLWVAARRELRSFQEKRREADLLDAAWSMERSLRDQGFARGEVEFRRRPEEGDIASAVFAVREGPRVELEKVSVEIDGEGKDAIPRSTLLSYFDFPSEGGLLGSRRVYYRRSAVEAAMKEVEKSFLLAGYYRVRVAPLDPGFSEDGARARPVVRVETGRLHRIAVAPPGDLPEPVLRRLPDFSSFDGRPYTVRLPATITAAIRTALIDRGYQMCSVEAAYRVPEEDEPPVVPVSFQIDPGPVVILRTVLVEGHDRTSSNFIKRIFDIEEGEPLAQAKLDRITERLYATGLFARVRLDIAPDEETSSDPRPADIHVLVEELEARSLDLELGYGSYELLRAGVIYRDRNWFGAGRIFDAVLRGSLKSGLFELRLTDPYTLGGDNTLFLLAGVDYRQEPSFTRESVYGDISVRHRIDSRTQLTGGYRYRLANVSEIETAEPIEETSRAAQAGFYATLRHDTRDNPLIPEEGMIASISAFVSSEALLADLNFIESSFQTAFYLRLSEDLETEPASTVLALGASFTTKQPFGGTSALPIQERLFLGGESSIRSFGEGELGPFDDRRIPLGGLTAFAAHAELRQRISGSLFAALFYDFGAVNEDSYDWSGPFGHAIGAGLRYYLPIGPARLDFGYNPGRRFASDDQWALHFSFGFSF